MYKIYQTKHHHWCQERYVGCVRKTVICRQKISQTTDVSRMVRARAVSAFDHWIETFTMREISCCQFPQTFSSVARFLAIDAAPIPCFFNPNFCAGCFTSHFQNSLLQCLFCIVFAAKMKYHKTISFTRCAQSSYFSDSKASAI